MISKRLCHASIRTTYDVSGHLFEGRDPRDALDVSATLDLLRTLGGSKVVSLDPQNE